MLDGEPCARRPACLQLAERLQRRCAALIVPRSVLSVGDACNVLVSVKHISPFTSCCC